MLKRIDYQKDIDKARQATINWNNAALYWVKSVYPELKVNFLSAKKALESYGDPQCLELTEQGLAEEMQKYGKALYGFKFTAGNGKRFYISYNAYINANPNFWLEIKGYKKSNNICVEEIDFDALIKLLQKEIGGIKCRK